MTANYLHSIVNPNPGMLFEFQNISTILMLPNTISVCAAMDSRRNPKEEFLGTEQQLRDLKPS